MPARPIEGAIVTAPEQVMVGGFTLDDTVLLDNRILRKAPGGNALYSAVGARLAGGRPGLASPVGRDYPQEYLDLMAHAGFDLSGVPRLDTPSMHIWALQEGPNRRQLIYWLDSGRNVDLDPLPEQIPPAWRAAAGVHIAGIPVPTQQAIASVFDRTRTVITLDASYVPGHIELDRERREALLGQVTAFLPSREEVQAIWGRQPSAETCRFLGRFGPEVVAIKLGDEGALVWSARSDQTWHVPACHVQVVDTTGAGDAFCGGFCTVYARNQDPVRATVAGAVSASFVIADFGGIHALEISPATAEARAAEMLPQVRSVG